MNIATSHPQAAKAFLENIMYPNFSTSIELTEPLAKVEACFIATDTVISGRSIDQ